MTLLPSISEEFGPMADTDELEHYINDMADICCLSRRKNPDAHDAIMDRFVEIQDLAMQAFGRTLIAPVGYPEGLTPEESARLEMLMTQYEFSDEVLTEGAE